MISAITKNLSVEGVRFLSEKKLEPGYVLKMEIFLTSESMPLRLGGEVIWCQSLIQPDGKEMFETGVKLFTVDRSDETRFIGYVCKKMSQDMRQLYK